MYSSYYLETPEFPGCWISPRATIGEGNRILPGTLIGEHVVIGSNNIVGPNVCIEGTVRIGCDNILMPNVVIGMPSRERITPSLDKRPSSNPVILIGDRNILQEGVTIRLPMQAQTVLEDDIAIGTNTHIAHDCHIRRSTIIGPNCSLGGFVTIGLGANLGLGIDVHPRLAIGAYSMCGLGSAIIRHVAPGAVVVGVPAHYLKPNLIGMNRHGLTQPQEIEIQGILSGASLTHCSQSVRELFLAFKDDAERWNRRICSTPNILKNLG